MSLQMTKDAPQSRLFRDIPSNVESILSENKVTYNAHYNCVSVDSYHKSHELQSFFSVLSTNQDSNGKVFISTMEGRRYPFYAVQWHPEMNSFEFNRNNTEGLGTNINHSYQAILTSQYTANFFVNEARKNSHKFPDSVTEDKHLIYNYSPIRTTKYGQFDEQMYVF